MSVHSPHNKIELYVHAIWSVKRREHLLTKTKRYALFSHMRQSARQEKIHLLSLNGVEDHVHALFEIHPTQNVSDIMQHLKGESSHWLNAQPVLQEDFNWQDGYAAYSVTSNAVPRVMNYIYNQEKHHRKSTFDEEMARLEQLAAFTIPRHLLL